MAKTNKIFNAITISLIILIGIGILGTYLSDYLLSINWFGDYQETRFHYNSERTYQVDVWGARHYWYNWGMFFLFLTALVRAICKIDAILDEQEEYETKRL